MFPNPFCWVCCCCGFEGSPPNKSSKRLTSAFGCGCCGCCGCCWKTWGADCVWPPKLRSKILLYLFESETGWGFGA